MQKGDSNPGNKLDSLAYLSFSITGNFFEKKKLPKMASLVIPRFLAVT